MARLLLLFVITCWEPDEPGFYGDAGEEIEYLRENPVNINTASLSELLSIPYLTPEIACCIIEGRPYRTKEELLSLPCMTPFIYRRISPFIFTGKLRRKKNVLYLAWKENIITGGKLKFQKLYLQWKSVEKDLRWYGEFMGLKIGDFRLDHGTGIICGAPSFFYPLCGGMQFDRGVVPFTSFSDEPMHGVAFSYKGWHVFFLPEDTTWGIKGRIWKISGLYSSYGGSVFFSTGERGRGFFAEVADSGIVSGISSSEWKVLGFNVRGKTKYSSFWWQGKGLYGWAGKEIHPDVDVSMYAIFTYEETLKEAGVEIETRPWKNGELGGRIKYKDGLKLRLVAGFKERWWQVKGRWEQVSGGSMAYISLALRKPVFIEARWILYDTGEAIYEYERDIPCSFSIVPLKGEGERYYIFMRYRIKNLGIYMKYDGNSFRMEARWSG